MRLRKHIKFIILLLTLITSSLSLLSCQTKKVSNQNKSSSQEKKLNNLPIRFFSPQAKKLSAYKRAKEVMGPDLYLVYRLGDRILQSNSINRPIRFAVRRGSFCTQEQRSKSPEKCEMAYFLPDIDKATNFDIWASQIVNTMQGKANASASSISGSIIIENNLLKEMMGRPNQIACIIAHELAHVTQNHSEERQKKALEYGIIAAEKITTKTTQLHRDQKTNYAIAAVLGGLSAGISGDSSSLNMLSNQIAINNLASQIAEPQITAMAMQYSPEVSKAINSMKGLSPGYLRKASVHTNASLRDASLSLQAFNRGQEYEADLLGLEYIATAGFDTQSCVKTWTETMPHNTDKIVARLLPEGIKDPGKSEEDVSIFINKEKIEEGCKSSRRFIKTNQELSNCKKSARKKRRKRRNPEEISEKTLALLSTHPSDERRAKALKEHLAKNTESFKNSKSVGKEAMTTNDIRNWQYDDESESVVISNILKSPKDVGREDSGTAGIDIDKFLDP